MTLQPLGFKRLVLGLQPGATSRAAELAAGFADLFGVELLRLFAAMPAARAVRASGAIQSDAE